MPYFTFQEVSLPASGGNAFSMRDVIWASAKTLFVAVGDRTGSDNSVLTSPDGLNWTYRTGIAGSRSWKGVTYAPSLGIFCAIGDSITTKVMTSSNGTSWTAQAVPEGIGGRSITWSPSLALFVAVGISGTHRVLTSPDGVTWTARTAADVSLNWTGVCWSSTLNLFCAVADATGSSPIMTSPDGITWTTRSLPVSLTSSTGGYGFGSSRVIWSPTTSKFIFIGTVSGVDYAFTSADGITWTQRTLPSGTWKGIADAPGAGGVIGIGQTSPNELLFTSNGIAWAASDPGFYHSWGAATWSNDLMVFLANWSGSNDLMLYGLVSLTPPTITSIVPSIGPDDGGTAFTITASGGLFTDNSKIYFGNALATDYVKVSATQATGVTPRNLPASYTVRVVS